MNVLLIDRKRFASEVWQSDDSLTLKDCNVWLQGACASLRDLYGAIEEGKEIETGDLYALGDIINMLEGTRIKGL